MHEFYNGRKVFIVFTALIAAALLLGCGAKPEFWGSPEKGFNLKYRASDMENLTYTISSTMLQTMDMMGNEITTDIKTYIQTVLEQKSLDQMGLRLSVTIDSMYVGVVSPMGSMKPDMKSINGKQFEMSLSPLGKEYDFEGVDAIAYSTAEGGKRSIKDQFQSVFPDLPEKKVKFGDSWTSSDTLNIDQGGMELVMVFSNVHTLEGTETMNGLECVKIATKVKGSLRGEGQQGPADFALDADIEGDDTWYFAYKKGVLVKMISEGLVEGTVAVTGPQDMSLPMSMETDIKIDLVK